MPRTFPLLLPLFAALAAACSSSAPLGAQDQDPAREGRRQALHRAGVAAPFVLMPVRLLGRADANIADVLGLTLERQGMSELEVAAKAFEPGDTAWEQLPAKFAAHVRASAPLAGGKRHALYAEFLGDPRQGPSEVRFVVVDGDGAIVLVDRQTPADAAFRRTAKKDPDPLGCSRLVAERLFELAEWQAVAGGVRDGRFAAKWEQKSGAPSRAERDAMQKRLDVLKERCLAASFAVQPPVCPGGPDGRDGGDVARFAALLTERLGGKPFAPAAAKLTVPAGGNQQRHLWDLAKALQKAQLASPVDADYVVAIEAAVDLGGAHGFVNLVVVDRAGACVLADFQNDQHPTWRRHAPKGLADAEKVAADRLRELLR